MMEIIPYDISSTFIVGQCNSYTEQDLSADRIDTRSNSEEQNVVDQTLVFAFKNLLRKYKKQMGDSKDISIVAGGLQQYLNRKTIQKPDTDSINDVHQDGSIFHSLPLDCKLHIFSFLGPDDLCRISQVCRDWYFVSEDNILWKELMERDIKTWNVIGHNTNPLLYQEVQSDWSKKEIYLKCSPYVNNLMHKNAVFSFTNFLKSFLPKKSAPKIAMFGPGLESDQTSGLVRKILYEDSTQMERTGLVSGQFEGVGSGWCYKLPNGQTFQLSVLYSASKQQRTQKSWNRMSGNNLIQVKKDSEGEETVDLKPAVRDFCRTVDAFVYVVDGTSRESLRAGENYELTAMLKERWSDSHVPVLVMSCIPDRLSHRIPCIDVVEALQLGNLNRPWQVRDCWIENLEGVIDSISWLIEQAHRR